jgi:hypothetical protein
LSGRVETRYLFGGNIIVLRTNAVHLREEFFEGHVLVLFGNRVERIGHVLGNVIEFQLSEGSRARFGYNFQVRVFPRVTPRCARVTPRVSHNRDFWEFIQNNLVKRLCCLVPRVAYTRWCDTLEVGLYYGRDSSRAEVQGGKVGGRARECFA